MKKGVISVLFLFFAQSFFGQSSNTRYWVAFKDKNGTPYSVSNPIQFLSQRAINRRSLHSFLVTVQDIPVNQTYVNQVKAIGAVIISRSRWYNGIVVRITNPSQLTAINALSFVQSTKSVARIIPIPTVVNSTDDNLEIQKNSSVISRTTEYAGGIETAMKASVSDIINLAVGDTIRIQASSSMTSPVIVSSNFDNYFCTS